MEFDGTVQILLDADEFARDAETFPIAKIVAAHAEKRRTEYRRTEKPNKCGRRATEVYWSDTVPWYEWMSEPQVLETCADECQLRIEELAAVIAYQIRPSNWQVFSWMSVALQERDYQEIITNQLLRHKAQIRQTGIERKALLSSAGSRGAVSRNARYAELKAWALDKAIRMHGSDVDVARRLSASLPTELADVSKDPERLIYEALRARKKVN